MPNQQPKNPRQIANEVATRMARQADRAKWEDTRKQKAQADALAAKVAKEFGYANQEKNIKKASDKLQAKREATAKKTGVWPNYSTN